MTGNDERIASGDARSMRIISAVEISLHSKPCKAFGRVSSGTDAWNNRNCSSVMGSCRTGQRGSLTQAVRASKAFACVSSGGTSGRARIGVFIHSSCAASRAASSGVKAGRVAALTSLNSNVLTRSGNSG